MKIYPIIIGFLAATISSLSFAGEGAAHDTGPLRAMNAVSTERAGGQGQDGPSSNLFLKNQVVAPVRGTGSRSELSFFEHIDDDEADVMLENGQGFMVSGETMGGR